MTRPKPRPKPRPAHQPKPKPPSAKKKCPDDIDWNLVVYDAEKEQNRHYNPATGELNIVQKDKDDTVSIVYSGPTPPTTAGVTCNGKAVADAARHARSGGQGYSVDVSYNHDLYARAMAEGFATTIYKAIWTEPAPVTHYVVNGFPKTVTINVYNPDQWKLTITIPPLQEFKIGVQMDNREEAHIQTSTAAVAKVSTTKNDFKLSTSVEGWNQKESIDISKSYHSFCAEYSTPSLYAAISTKEFTRKFSHEKKKSESKIGITLELNGSLITVDMAEIIYSIIKLIQEFVRKIKEIKDSAPKVGWYIDLSWKVFDGTLEYCWGWRENSDYLVYYYQGFSTELTLLEIMLEFGFGITLVRGKVEAQICIQFKGSASIKCPGIETSGPSAASITIGGTKHAFTAGGYVRFNAGDLVKIEGGISSTITLESLLSIEVGKGAKLDNSLRWDGVKITASARSPFGSGKKEFIPIDEEEIAKFEYPKPNPDDTVEMTRPEVEDEILSRLNEGWWGSLKFMDSFDANGNELVEIQTYLVASRIASHIMKQSANLLLDKKTVTGLSQAIRKKCIILGKRSWSRDYVLMDDLDTYLKSQEFLKVLSDAWDPGKMLKKQIKGK